MVKDALMPHSCKSAFCPAALKKSGKVNNIAGRLTLASAFSITSSSL
jgi:hypothetical protein